jgi:hypothetical protein
MADEDDQVSEIDRHVMAVAERLPFDVQLEADMGGTFILQIDLGSRGDADDPHDRATIDPGEGEVWWMDVDFADRQIKSPYGLDADPADVAAWIAREAVEARSPAAMTPAARASLGMVSAAGAAAAHDAPATAGARGTDRAANIDRSL